MKVKHLLYFGILFNISVGILLIILDSHAWLVNAGWLFYFEYLKRKYKCIMNDKL